MNDQRKPAMGRKIGHVLNGEVHGNKVTSLGLTFKPKSEDESDAPLDHHRTNIDRRWSRSDGL